MQGEGGINPLDPEFLALARELADEHGALLCLDEIQTGIGRTGTFFAFEQTDVRPDLVTLAKGLANGLPIGALLVSNAAPRGFVPGDHASTFGGNLVASAAACAVVDLIDEELLQNVRERGEQLRAGLAALPGVTEARGVGLLVAAQTEKPAARGRRGRARAEARHDDRRRRRAAHAAARPSRRSSSTARSRSSAEVL